ncbi:DUF167 domain-containing protein [Candidatus Babela massiliensis]|uniref:UPF0235 protein BABL1_gene_449 n=1 Tax=Candidatus Babela massiliensis TaxID=673862 RepID=V6DG41_9BACT|nr:DUF167 domain-containing protein [Candidatus Babela massiliensis]CDK30567.1 Uncharacterized conserved protein [Candidatus Babela massiliensis]
MSVIIAIKVTPKSKCSKILLDKSGRLCIHLTSVPENGKANYELIKLLSKLIKVPQSNIEIVSGLTSRLKKIKITGFLTQEEVLNKLNLSVQNKLF